MKGNTYVGRGGRTFKVRRVNKKTGRRAYKLKTYSRYNLHMYKRWATSLLQTASAPATAYNNVLTFDLSQVRNSSELTALYDQYMIVGVKVIFHLVTNPDASFRTNQSANNNASNFYPKLFYCRDYDNSTVESTNDLRERNNTKCKVLRPNSMVSVYVRPAIRNQVYLDGVTTATSPVWKQWIDCSTTQVPHYGLKYSIDFLGLTTANDFNITVEQIYYLKFKNAR